MNSAYTSLALNLQYRALFEWLYLAGAKLALGVTQQESWSALYSAACTVSALLVSLQAIWPAALLCTVVVRLAWKHPWTRLHCNYRSAVPFLQHVIQEHSWNVPMCTCYLLQRVNFLHPLLSSLGVKCVLVGVQGLNECAREFPPVLLHQGESSLQAVIFSASWNARNERVPKELNVGRELSTLRTPPFLLAVPESAVYWSSPPMVSLGHDVPLLFFLYIYIYTSFQFHFTSLRAFMCSHLVCRLPHLFFSLHCPQPGTQFREARTPHILVKSRVTPAPNMASRMMWYSSAVLAGCLVSAVGS